MPTPNIPTSFERRTIARKLCGAVREYFKDEKHRREFQEWHLNTYGYQYEFKKEVCKCETRKRKSKPKST